MSRYVDINKVLEELYLSHKDVIYIDKNACAERIKKIPSIDIVRCRDCKYWRTRDDETNCCAREYATDHWCVDDFCSYGVKK